MDSEKYLRKIFWLPSFLHIKEKTSDDLTETYHLSFSNAEDALHASKLNFSNDSRIKSISLVTNHKLRVVIENLSPLVKYLFERFGGYGKIKSITLNKLKSTSKTKIYQIEFESSFDANEANDVLENAILMFFHRHVVTEIKIESYKSSTIIVRCEDVQSNDNKNNSSTVIDDASIEKIINSERYTDKQKLMILTHFA